MGEGEAAESRSTRVKRGPVARLGRLASWGLARSLCFALLLGCLTSHGREYATRASVSVRCMLRWYNDDDDDDEQIWSGLWMEMMIYCYFYEGVTGELANNLVCVEVGGFANLFEDVLMLGLFCGSF
jgi:hypothetical protein